MRSVSLLLPLALALPTARAQRPANGPQEPSYWLSMSGGFLVMQRVADGSTDSNWDFSNGWPLRVSLERSLGGGATLGVQLTYARVPLRYISSGSCSSCDAHATVASYGPILRVGAGNSWYRVLEIFAGVLQYGSFTQDHTDVSLPPASPNRDFALSVGYGFGLTLGRDWAVEVMPSYLMAVHERTNLPGNASSVVRHWQTLLAVRMGL